MCIFTGPIRHVSGTGIFARGAEDGLQMLAYSMKVSVGSEVAMVLPLPVPPSPAEDAVRFIDLSGYEDLFEEMARAIFPAPAAIAGVAVDGVQTFSLKVHDVGSFEASFVPTIADFARLDPRFQLSGEVWEALPAYHDYGFAVFKLKATAEEDRKVHPMAFSFPRRRPHELFFPTVHVHDGTVHEEAEFDHRLFYQPADPTPPAPPVPPATGGPPVVTTMPEWMCSYAPAGVFLDIPRTNGLVDPEKHIWGKAIWGRHLNRDVVVPDPP